MDSDSENDFPPFGTKKKTLSEMREHMEMFAGMQDVTYETLGDFSTSQNDSDPVSFLDFLIDFHDQFHNDFDYDGGLGAALYDEKYIIQKLIDDCQEEDDWNNEFKLILGDDIITLSVNKIVDNLNNWDSNYSKEQSANITQMGIYGKIVFG